MVQGVLENDLAERRPWPAKPRASPPIKRSQFGEHPSLDTASAVLDSVLDQVTTSPWPTWRVTVPEDSGKQPSQHEFLSPLWYYDIRAR